MPSVTSGDTPDTFLPPDSDCVPPQPGALDLDLLLATLTLL